jgi:poly(3-hydroxybutyrate) depolymerase
MTCRRLLSPLLVCSTAALFWAPGCGSSGSGTGATGSGGTSATGGAIGSGGSNATGGRSATGGSNGTGGTPAGTGGRLGGTGGTGPAGTGGSPSGTGGSAAGGRGGQSGGGGHATGGGSGGAAGAGTGGSTGTGGSGATTGMSAGCGKAPTIASSMYNNGMPISIMAANMQRRYILSVPTNYDNTKPYKLVIAYHALNSNDHSVYNEKYYGLLPLSNNSTIFVAPNGQKNGAPCTGTGGNESGCGWPNTSDQDMQLADAVVKQVEDNFCVDTNRIFATGWSYGASMSEQTACERPLGGTQAAGWGVRGIAIYAVAYLSNSTNCKASKPVAYYATHGTCDGTLPYDGTPRCSTMTQEQGGVGIAKTWAGVDGCTWKLPTKVTSGAHVCTKLTGCMDGYPLEFCSFNGDHTAYPDNTVESTSWGPAEAWAFLNQF